MGSELNKALAAVQKELPHVTENKVGKIDGVSKTTGRPFSYEYKYADITAVAEAIMPLLGRNGLAFTARPTLIDGRFVLAYSLLHESGEREDGEYPLPERGTPQELGKHISYGRRYCLTAVTGVAPGGDDNDAADASEVHTDRPRSAPPAPAPRAVLPQRNTPDMWDEVRSEERPGSYDPADMRAIGAMYYGKLGFDSRTDELHVVHTSEQLLHKTIAGPEPGKSLKNLSFRDAKELRGKLAAFKGDRAALLAQLAGITRRTEAVAAQDAAEGSQETPEPADA